MSGRFIISAALVAILSAAPLLASDVICAGDCNYDGAARMDELVTGVNIALGNRPITACAGFDPGGDGQVTVDELLGGVRNALDGCPRARFEPAACDPLLLPDGQDIAKLRCGALIVPENRRRQNGHTIRLASVVLRATGPHPSPDPLVVLSGGPGQWALASVLPVFTGDFAAPLQAKRDLVFFDQRGTGRTQPALNCPEVLAQSDRYAELLTPPEEAERDARNVVACHDRLTAAGNDLAGYNSAATAQDIADLMTALGYDRFNLYGLSYGTRVALTALRDLPNQRIRSAVLDSVVPLQVDFTGDAAAVSRSFDLLVADCAANAGCDRAYPNLRQTTADLYDRLNAAPPTLQPMAPDGHLFTVVLTGDRLIRLAGNSLQSAALIPFLPFFTNRLASGDTTLVTGALGQIGGPELYSPGAQLSVLCNEEWPFVTPEKIALAKQGVDAMFVRAYSADAYLDDTLLAACAQWGAAPDALDNQSVSSEVPALVFAGQYDTATPPAWSQLAAAALPHSFFFEFRGFGHVVLFQQAAPTGPPACAMQVLAQFLDDPTHAPDGSCVAAIPPPAFIGS